MIDNQDDGVISKTYDKYKEAIDSELAKSNVQDVVDKQSQTAEFLQEAKDGKLTYKDYLERKRGLLYKSLPDIDSFTDKQKEVFEKCIKTLNPEQINALQYELSTLPKDKDKYKDAKLKFYGLFRNMSMTEQKSNVTVDKTNFKTTKYIQNKEFIPKNGDRLMTFEEVYQLEQGVEFKKENIQKYNESITKFALASKLSNTKETVDKSISRALEQYNVDSTTGLNSTDLNNANLALTLKGAIAQIYGKDKVAEGLKDLTDGKYILDDDTKSIEELTNKYHGSIKDIAKLIQTKINERCDKAMGGKSLEDYAKTMAKDYKNAYGFRDANALANSFAQDQEGVVQAARNGVQILGTAIMIAGMAFFPPAALVGALIASFGGIGVEALNESTKENVSSEKMDELKKEFAQNAALFAVGAGAGKLGSSVKAMLTAKNAPKFVAMIGDIGVDSTVSLIGDLVLTGDLDITGEGFSQVMSLVAGHKGKIVKGVQHLKEKINDKFRLQSENPNRNIMQMPNGTLVEVKPDGSTVEIKTDEVSQNNHRSEQPIEWKKVNIGGEEIEVAMTRDVSGNTSIDFSRARRLNADGKYEEFKVTTQEHLLADEVQIDNKYFKSKEEFKEYLNNERKDFNESDKSLLLEIYENNPHDVQDLLNITIKNSNGETVPRFDAFDILGLVFIYRENPQIVKDMANITIKDKLGRSVPIFSGDSIAKLAPLYKENSQAINELSIMTKKGVYGRIMPRFNVLDVAKLAPLYKENPQFMKNLLNIKTNENELLSALEIELFGNNSTLLNKSSIEILSNKEKYEFINLLLTLKNNIESGKLANIKEIAPFFPTTSDDYIIKIKKVAESLNIQVDKLPLEQQMKFDNSINSLSGDIKEMNLSDLSDINLKYSQKDFLSDINELLNDLPKEEQLKLQNKFGFKIVDGKLTGYPKTVKDIGSIAFENKELLNKINEKVNSFSNNNALTVKDNPQLNSLLNDLLSNCPEILNQIDGSADFANTIKRLQTIVKREDFKTLSEPDKKIMLLAALVENTDKSINTSKDAAFDVFFIGQKYGLSDNEAKKLYYIVESNSDVETFMQSTKDVTVRNYCDSAITGQDRQDKFDMMALNLKEDNCLIMSQMLYSSKYPEGFTRNFDKVLENRINEIKSQDFILPQTPKEQYNEYANLTEVQRGDKNYSVNVVQANDIPDLYAFIHTPEAGFTTGGSRNINFANFEAFATLNDDKVICTSYVSADKASLVKECHNGFIFEVQNDKQYVAYGNDMFSFGKNIQDIVVEYYRDKGFKAATGKVEEFVQRTFVSNIMKQMLFGKDYYQMSKDVVNIIDGIKNKYDSQLQTLKTQRQNIIKNTFGTDNITNAQYQKLKFNPEFVKLEQDMIDLNKQQRMEIENIPEYNKLKDMDNKYIARLDNVKAKLGDKPMTLENIRTIDSELADVYKTMLAKDQLGDNFNLNDRNLLNSKHHNEVLVSNPKITGIFTDDINNIPEEYLIKAQEENLPIVVF